MQSGITDVYGYVLNALNVNDLYFEVAITIP